MRKLLLPMLLITALTVTPLTTSCYNPDDVLAGTILGVVILGSVIYLLLAGDDPNDIMVPVDPMRLTPSPELSTIVGDFKIPSERDWYTIPILNPGDSVTIWAESVEGTMAIITDGNGNLCKSDNGDVPGSNFRIEIHALDQATVNLMVYGINENEFYRYVDGTDRSEVPSDISSETRTYTLHWVYEFGR